MSSRRAFLKRIAGSLGSAYLFKSFLCVPLHVMADDASLSHEGQFLFLCRELTKNNELDMQTLVPVYFQIIHEPWGREHISAVYKKLKANNPIYSDEEKWFIDHVLTTLFLGIYYHAERKTKRVLYQDALMFDAVRDIMPIPYIDAVGTGEWVNKP